MSYTLPEFLAELDKHAHRVPLPELTQKLGELEIDIADVRDFIHFEQKTYRRNLMHAGPGYHALVLCWRNGQRSPIHDHRNSSCAVRILQGIAHEIRYIRDSSGHCRPVSSREYFPGTVMGSQDDDIHEMSNLSPGGDDLITLHIYSPPLLGMRTYTLENAATAEFDDPIHECCYGAGI